MAYIVSLINLNNYKTMDQNETIVPGRNYVQQNEQSNATRVNNASTREARGEANEGSPVVGFLYSISRQGVGEYWPIRLGRNTIGRSESCDIQLAEASVSDLHASLSVKIMKSSGRLVASIKDEGSKTGLFLNDEELAYDNHSCKNLDVVVVGSSYRILIVLIDAPDYGLTAADNFISTSVSAATTKPASAEPVNEDPFTRPAHVNINETIDIERPGLASVEKTRCL